MLAVDGIQYNRYLLSAACLATSIKPTKSLYSCSLQTMSGASLPGVHSAAAELGLALACSKIGIDDD